MCIRDSSEVVTVVPFPVLSLFIRANNIEVNNDIPVGWSPPPGIGKGEGSWGSFEIEFLKDNKFFIKQGNGHTNKTFNSFSHISEMATYDEIRHFHFQDDGYIKIFKNIYKRYS